MTSHARVLGWTALAWLAESHSSEAEEADHVTVQHILIGFRDGFRDTVPGHAVSRTKDQAERFARELLKKARHAKTDFDELVAKHSDDHAPGIYKMSNKGVLPFLPNDEFPRDRIVPAFGDVGFKLKVGEVGLAKYDSKRSPFGYHIIKRIK